MRIGPSFGAELLAVWCAEGVSWNAEGEITYGPEDMTVDDGASVVRPEVKAVLAAHDPDKSLPEAVPDSASKLGLMRALRGVSKGVRPRRLSRRTPTCRRIRPRHRDQTIRSADQRHRPGARRDDGRCRPSADPCRGPVGMMSTVSAL